MVGGCFARASRYCVRYWGMAFDTWDHEDVLAARLDYGVMSSAFWSACFSNAHTSQVLFVAAMLGSALAIVIAITRRHGETGARVISVGMLSRHGHAVLSACGMRCYSDSRMGDQRGLRGCGHFYLSHRGTVSDYFSRSAALLIFLLAALVAFSIGTSWTTMAILIPTVVPLAHALGGLPLTILAAAAVLDGAILAIIARLLAIPP